MVAGPTYNPNVSVCDALGIALVNVLVDVLFLKIAPLIMNFYLLSNEHSDRPWLF